MIQKVYCIAIILFSLIFLGHLNPDQDNSLLSWLSPTHPVIDEYREMEKQFGSDNILLIYFPSNLHKNSDLQNLDHTLKNLSKLAGIHAVFSILDAFKMLEGNEEILTLTDENIKSLYNHSQKIELFRSLFFPSLDSATGHIAILNLKTPILPKQSQEILDFLQNSKLDFLSESLFNSRINQLSDEIMPIWLSLLVLVLCLLLLIFFRSIQVVFVLLTLCFLTILPTMEIFFLCGFHLNALVSIVPAILFILTLSSSIHVLFSFLRNRHSENLQKSALRECFQPLFFSKITSITGFATLCLSPVLPITQTGLFCSIGLIFSFCNLIFFFPLLFKICNLQSFEIPQNGQILQKYLEVLHLMIQKYHRLIAITIFILFTFFAYQSFSLESNSHAIDMLGKKDPVRISALNFCKNTGKSLRQVLISIESEKGFDLAKIYQVLKTSEVVKKVFGPSEILSYLHDNLEGSTTEPDFEWYLSIHKEISQMEETRWIFGFLLKNRIRFLVDLKEFSPTKIRIQLEKLRSQLNSHGKVQMASPSRLAIEMDSLMLNTLSSSIFLALILLFVILIFYLKSPFNAVIAMLPNLMPVCVVLGFLGLFSIPVNVAIAMIGSITLGISIDDTLHILKSWEKEGEERIPTLPFQSTMIPVTLTSVIFLCGFSVLSLCSFLPVRYFGILMSLTAVSAWLCDLLWLPSLMGLFRR